jgi:ATP-dependent Clp protease, protease subunit
MRAKRSIFKPKARAAHRIEAKEKEATVYIYDEISWFGVDAAVLVKDIAAIEADTIHLRVNSPGGSVFDGMAIYNSLKQHKAKVVTHIDGLAASIASIIALAGDEIVAGEGAYMMIHSPWSVVIGDAEDLRKEADLLDKVTGTIAEIYQNKSGMKSDEVLDMMAAETWMTGAEALENHFIDRVETSEKAQNKAILFDLSVFANTPDALLDDPGLTERGLEKALRDAGCSRAQAKSILSGGLPEDLRDAETPKDEPVQVVNQRDAGEPDQREADEPEKKKKDRVAELLIRAEKIKSTLNEGIEE